MEYFSMFLIGIIFFGFIFYFYVKSKVGEIPKYSEDEAASKIRSMERWIEKYKSMPEEKKTEDMRSKYRSKYIEMRDIQLQQQKFTAIRKDIGIDDRTRTSLEEYFPIAEREIDLVKSGVDPEEARKIAYKGTRYERYFDLI